MAKVALAASLPGRGPLSSDLKGLAELSASVAWLQVRADLIDDIPASHLRSYYPGKLLYMLPSCNYGGSFQGSPLERQQRILSAAKEYDLVGLDADSDLVPEVLTAIPARQRMICCREPDGNVADLSSVFARASSVPARFYTIITKGSKLSDGLRPLLLLKALGRRDVTAFCEGKAGFWSRLLAPHFGAPFIYGRLDNSPVTDSGEPSIQQLIEDYGFPQLHPLRELYGIVGQRVFQSPSPRLHNAGYRLLHHPALFIPFYAELFGDFWSEMIEAQSLESLGLSIKGLTIVSPYKEAAFEAVARRSPMAWRAAASNICIKRNGFWEAHTTDPESVAGVTGSGWKSADPLRAAVIGCGGAGRAIAALLQQSGLEVTLVNRGLERGELAVGLLGLPFVALSDFQASAFSLLVNATPVGRDDDSVPFAIDALRSGTVVVDLVYRARPTPLAAAVTALGGAVVDGYDVLLNQVRKQFEMMTGREMPATIGRKMAAPGEFVGHSSNRTPHYDGTIALSPKKERESAHLAAWLQAQIDGAEA